jgi:hypothetical protein
MDKNNPEFSVVGIHIIEYIFFNEKKLANSQT